MAFRLPYSSSTDTRLRDMCAGFDNFTVVMDSDGKQQLIYKHAISTIIPLRPVQLYVQEAEE